MTSWNVIHAEKGFSRVCITHKLSSFNLIWNLLLFPIFYANEALPITMGEKGK